MCTRLDFFFSSACFLWLMALGKSCPNTQINAISPVRVTSSQHIQKKQ